MSRPTNPTLLEVTGTSTSSTPLSTKARLRNQSGDPMVRSRREAIALDGFMFDALTNPEQYPEAVSGASASVPFSGTRNNNRNSMLVTSPMPPSSPPTAAPSLSLPNATRTQSSHEEPVHNGERSSIQSKTIISTTSQTTPTTTTATVTPPMIATATFTTKVTSTSTSTSSTASPKSPSPPPLSPRPTSIPKGTKVPPHLLQQQQQYLQQHQQPQSINTSNHHQQQYPEGSVKNQSFSPPSSCSSSSSSSVSSLSQSKAEALATGTTVSKPTTASWPEGMTLTNRKDTTVTREQKTKTLSASSSSSSESSLSESSEGPQMEGRDQSRVSDQSIIATSTSSTTPQRYSPNNQTQAQGRDINGSDDVLLTDRAISPNTKRQNVFSGSQIQTGQDMDADSTPASFSSPSSDESQDIKEVQIETEDPSHLFWVPFHLHPEIAPNEYNKWLTKHGVDSKESNGLVVTRDPSVQRRKSVLSVLYNPENETEERPSVPPILRESEHEQEEEISENEASPEDFFTGVFSVPLEHMGEPPLKTKTSIRRSVSLSVQSPTKDKFPSNIVEEDLMAATKRPGGLERSGLSLLRRSARTKIRRNSTASNDGRPETSHLRHAVDMNGEYPAVTLVDPGPVPLQSKLSTSLPTASSLPAPTEEESNKPLRRFVSTLRDASKPTITTYVEPHLLNQAAAAEAVLSGATEALETIHEKASKSANLRISAPAQLESPLIDNSTTGGISEAKEALERVVNLEQYSKVTFPIPPPTKLPQNLLQQPSKPVSPAQSLPPAPALTTKQQQQQRQQQAQQSSSPQAQQQQVQHQYQRQTPPHRTQSDAGAQPPHVHGHAKKPSAWSWLWGKEKEKQESNAALGGQQQQHADYSQADPKSTNSQLDNLPTPTTEQQTTIKKQSTLSMLFSRNGKATTIKSSATTSEDRGHVNASANGGVDHFDANNGANGRTTYTNYNRYPIHIERAIYRLSHVKLANPRRPLHEQVLISNMMFWYLGVIQQQQQQQQAEQLAAQQQQQQAQNEQDGQGGGKGGDTKKGKAKKRKSQKKKTQRAQQLQQQQLQQQLQQQQQQQAQEQSLTQQQQEQLLLQQQELIIQQQQQARIRAAAASDQAGSGQDSVNMIEHQEEYDEESMMGGGYDLSESGTTTTTGTKTTLMSVDSLQSVPLSMHTSNGSNIASSGHYQPLTTVPVSI